jgi:hypothetical protein
MGKSFPAARHQATSVDCDPVLKSRAPKVAGFHSQFFKCLRAMYDEKENLYRLWRIVLVITI